MSSPIMIDDGGSTRIKQLKDNVTMDHLLDAFQDTSADPFVNNANAFSCVLKVRFHDDISAATHLVPPGGQNLNPGDIVLIVSSNAQQIRLTFAADFRMIVTLMGTVAGVSPIVEAKQDLRRRRYIVTNAGPIQTVAVNGGAPIFDAGVTPSVYTMAHFII